MTDKPVSVVIPVYNAARFVEEAVRSAVMQPEVAEIILVEDGSHDASGEVCRRLAATDNRVQFHTHPDGKNHGAAESRNVGIKNADGRYIAFLDADDYYLPERFRTAVDTLENNPEVDGVYEASEVQIRDDVAGEEWTLSMESGLYPVSRVMSPADLVESFINGSARFDTNSITVRRTLFDRTGLFNPVLRLSEDTVMWFKMITVGKLVPGRTKEPVAIRTIHGNNRSCWREDPKFIRFHIDAYENLWLWLKSIGADPRIKTKILRKLISVMSWRYKGCPACVRHLMSIMNIVSAGLRRKDLFSAGELCRALFIVSGLKGLTARCIRIALVCRGKACNLYQMVGLRKVLESARSDDKTPLKNGTLQWP